MSIKSSPIFSLDQFTGPLRFLLQLIQKSEIDIRDVPLQKITTQYLERLEKALVKEVEEGAEFIETAAILLWVKSRELIPQQTPLVFDEISESETDRILIERIVDYYQSKCLGKKLSEKENDGFFLRQPPPLAPQEETSGLENLTLDNLAILFTDLVSRMQKPQWLISTEEESSLEEQISWVRHFVYEKKNATMTQIMGCQKTKEMTIITFLAILELMKIGEIRIVRVSSEVSLFACHHETAMQSNHR